MKKLITVFLLICVIITSFTFSVLYVSFNILDPGNYINRTLRKRILKYQRVRYALRLHQVGDARFDYMVRTHPLEIFPYYQNGVSLEKESLSDLPQKLKPAIGKFRKVIVHEPVILHNLPDKVSDKELEALLLDNPPEYSFFRTSIPVHIFVLKYYTEHPSYAGLVVNDSSVFLFKNPITYVSEEQSSPATMEISTILHEFGHLLGAEHISDPDCILADTVENLNFLNQIQDIRDSYCSKDVAEMKKALAL